MKVLLRTGFVLCSLLTSLSAFAEDRVIYGEDNRKELFDPTNDQMLLDSARSTAILIEDKDLIKNAATPEVIGLPTKSFKQRAGVCDNERFASQASAGFCSGFLVGDDLFVTAGHCIENQEGCDAISMVFGFGYDKEDKDLSKVSAKEVYHCKSIVKRELQQTATGRDYAVIKLDRPVVGRAPLKLRRTGAVHVGDGVAVIGNPVGLPTKITDGAKVRSVKAEQPYFVANLDTYGGNSGSAVFNLVTGEVEGILVRGETDFDSSGPGGCRVSRVCKDNTCRGEDVTKTELFKEFVPE